MGSNKSASMRYFSNQMESAIWVLFSALVKTHGGIFGNHCSVFGVLMLTKGIGVELLRKFYVILGHLHDKEQAFETFHLMMGIMRTMFSI